MVREQLLTRGLSHPFSPPSPRAFPLGKGETFPVIPQSPEFKVFPLAKILRSTLATWFTPEIKSPTAPHVLQFCIVAYRETPSDYKAGGSAEDLSGCFEPCETASLALFSVLW